MKDCVLFAPMIGSREGELTAGEAKALEAHLATCAACRAVAQSTAALDGLVGEALLARANARDFAPFVDQVMEKVASVRGASVRGASVRGASVRPEPVEGRMGVPGRGSTGSPRPVGTNGSDSGEAGRSFLPWLRRHRRAAVATLAPALAALAVIVYVRLGSGVGEIAMLELSSEGEATTILQTSDGPVLLLNEENDS
jgi:anti-sigma factor RsiW